VTDILFRRVRPNELKALLALYRHLNPVDAPLPEESELRLTWEALLDDPRMQCFVAAIGQDLVASCTLAVLPNLTRGARPYGLIENVVTHAAYRQRGIGTKLLQHALQTAWDNNCYKVMLLTGSRLEETHRFYERAGFKKGLKTGFVATQGY
jgi:GNAT superfamily N-acetyltransferase